MTNRREVDLDLLADYIGGALDGTPEAAVVERLIADDPAWSRAYAQTSAAMEAVSVDLGTLGADRDQMPPDVVGRLEAVLTPVLPGEGATVVRLAQRRRWMRRLVPVAVAATVLACVGLGVTVLNPGSANRDAATSTAGGRGDSERAPAVARAPELSPVTPFNDDAAKVAPKHAPAPATAPASVTPPILATATDYTRDTVRKLTVARASAKSSLGGVSQQLRPLADPEQLSACLAAITTALGQPGRPVLLVDLARFEGSPAVVVLLTDWVWVSGPGCGRTGPDTRYSTRIQGG